MWTHCLRFIFSFCFLPGDSDLACENIVNLKVWEKYKIPWLYHNSASLLFQSQGFFSNTVCIGHSLFIFRLISKNWFRKKNFFSAEASWSPEDALQWLTWNKAEIYAKLIHHWWSKETVMVLNLIPNYTGLNKNDFIKVTFIKELSATM